MTRLPHQPCAISCAHSGRLPCSNSNAFEVATMKPCSLEAYQLTACSGISTTE